MACCLLPAQRVAACRPPLATLTALALLHPCARQFGCFWVNGQVCSATSRLLVHESIASPLYARLKQRAEAITIGHPLDPDARMGPLVRSALQPRVAQAAG